MRQEAPQPIEVFYIYAHQDQRLRKRLETHLSAMRQQGMIAEWHDRKIVAGTDWKQSIDAHLMTAAVILLLISPDFLASDYCYGVEMQRALARHAAGDACVIPVILRPVDWQGTPFAHLQCVPTGAKPVTKVRKSPKAGQGQCHFLQDLWHEISILAAFTTQMVLTLVVPYFCASLFKNNACVRITRSSSSRSTLSFGP